MKKPKSHIADALLALLHGPLQTDIKAEAFVELLINGNLCEFDEINIQPLNNFARDHSNDVLGIHHEYPDLAQSYHKEDKPLIQVQTSRSTILDYLPESFYLSPFDEGNQDSLSTEEKRIHKNRQKKQLQSAKRFFQPIELESNRLRIANELNEVDTLGSFKGIFEDIWGEIIQDDPRWIRFIKTLHMTSYIVGDKEKTARLIEFVIGKKVTIDLEWKYIPNTITEPKVELGSAPLGQALYAGSIVYTDALIANLTIQDLAPEDFFSYFQNGSSSSKLIDHIIKYYFPLDTETIVHYQIQNGMTDFNLNKKGAADESILGYMTTI